MATRLPPLVWLRAFEAAGRLESFRAAAEELNVTPSAISHHVRSLEQHLGRPLFQRSGNRVRLTSEGAAYLAEVSAGFTRLAAAADVLAEAGAPRTLTIGALPFLVNEVLMPSIAELRAQLPGVTISVVSNIHLSALTEPDPGRRVDAIVRYGDGRFPGCAARKLTHVALVPIVGADLATEDADAAMALIVRGPRITLAGRFQGWPLWARQTGVELARDAEVLTFDSYPSAMRAIEQGLGVGLGLRPLVDAWLAAGRVRVLVDRPVDVDQASYLVTAQHSAGRPELDRLADWLIARFG